MSIITSIRELLAPKPVVAAPVARAPQFDDPDAVEPELLRCFYCNVVHVMHVETGYDTGCKDCGSRRMRPVGILTDAEMADLIRAGFNPDGWRWEEDNAYAERLRAKRAIDHKFQVKKAVTKEREDNLRKRDRLAGRTIFNG